MYVGGYAEKDAELTLELFKVLSREISKQNLNEIFDLETQLFPCLIDMKFKGVRVDVEKASKLKSKMVSEEHQLLSEVKKETVEIAIAMTEKIIKEKVNDKKLIEKMID